MAPIFSDNPSSAFYLADDQGTLIMQGIANYIDSVVNPSAGAASFTISPSSKNFGSVTVGSTSSATTFTVAVTGATGNVTSVSSSNATEFAVTGGTCVPSKSLASGNSCTVTVTFSPSSTGSRSGTLSVLTNGSPATLTASLSGTGSGTPPASGQLSFAASQSLGSQKVGTQGSSVLIPITNVGSASVTISSIVSSNAGEFPITTNTCTTAIVAGGTCSVGIAFKPSATGSRSSTLTVTSTGTGSPQATSLTGTGTSSTSSTITPNEGIWWVSGGAESGWGVNVSQQQDMLFLTWFTFAPNGSTLWLVTQALRTPGTNTFTGAVFSGTGPAFNSVPFDPSKVVGAPAGSLSFTFTDAQNGTLNYTSSDGSVTLSKPMSLQVFGTSVPTCTWSSTANLAAATNYQDMWWASPAGTESGWGINIAHQGNLIYATWFTFGADGKPVWMVFGAPQVSANTYSGSLVTGSGTPLGATWNPAALSAHSVGTGTLTFTDGNHATFSYTVTGVAAGTVTQTKAITREIYGSSGGTVCH
ncbi:MAG: choice-of-anchor D domain-containing protein [Proteobacteria bacterium]|nr:choice-of-anchor D domain-containing protein [Pseudomonadota bacterium]